jgi:hypothetical protein
MMKNILTCSLLLLFTACTRSSSHDRLVKTLKTTQSWAATAKMVGESWQQGNIPARYASQTLTKGREEIDKQVKELDAAPALLPQVQQTLKTMAESIDRNSKTEIATSLQKISAQQQQLKALARSAGAQS